MLCVIAYKPHLVKREVSTGSITPGVETYKKALNKSMTMTMNEVDMISDEGYQVYNNTTITGNNVLYAIEEYDGLDVAIVIETQKSFYNGRIYNLQLLLNGTNKNTCESSVYSLEDDGVYYISSYDRENKKFGNDKSRLRLKTDIYYIDLTAKFKARLIKDKSNNIIGIYFKEQGRY